MERRENAAPRPLARRGGVCARWERLLLSIRGLLAQPAPDKAARVAHLHYRPTPYFVGREKDLDDIHEKLFTNPTAVLTQGHVAAVTALGGVGKTTLARQYAEKFWRLYPQMFWVDCRRNLESEFARIHDILRPGTLYAELKDAGKAAWVRAELSRNQGPLRLLILDNAEDEESVKHWIPPTGNCHMLITSRFTAWSLGAETCPVWVLEPEPARDGRVLGGDRRADALAKKFDTCRWPWSSPPPTSPRRVRASGSRSICGFTRRTKAICWRAARRAPRITPIPCTSLAERHPSFKFRRARGAAAVLVPRAHADSDGGAGEGARLSKRKPQ